MDAYQRWSGGEKNHIQIPFKYTIPSRRGEFFNLQLRNRFHSLEHPATSSTSYARNLGNIVRLHINKQHQLPIGFIISPQICPDITTC